MLMRSRSVSGSISIGLGSLWALWIWSIPVLASAETLPASVRACAAETDSLKRLVCYDREVARYIDVKPTTKHEGAANPPTDGAAAAAAAGAGAAAAAPSAGLPANPPPAAATSPASASSSHPAQPGTAAGEPAHLSARVVGIDHVPNEMVLHLDNGQIWQQLQPVPGDLSLQVGDTVKIDKRLGTYWLTGPHVSGMKVRQKS
jgi:hypothetical protein